MIGDLSVSNSAAVGSLTLNGGMLTLLGNNSYTGTTTINGASTLVINSVAMVGSGASSLGAPSNANAINIISGTLRYIGSGGTTNLNSALPAPMGAARSTRPAAARSIGRAM